MTLELKVTMRPCPHCGQGTPGFYWTCVHCDGKAIMSLWGWIALTSAALLAGLLLVPLAFVQSATVMVTLASIGLAIVIMAIVSVAAVIVTQSRWAWVATKP